MTSPLELPTPTAGQRASQRVDRQAREHDRLIGRAKALSWLSLGWMAVEGAVAITAALIAGSVALLGFGIDSAIEGVASVIVIWRFGLLANTLIGLWWLDPAIALAIVALAVREGREAWAGEGCACAAIPGLDAWDGACHEECCG